MHAGRVKNVMMFDLEGGTARAHGRKSVLQRGKLDGLLRRKCLERLVNVPGWPAIQILLQSLFVGTAVGPAACSESVPYSS